MKAIESDIEAGTFEFDESLEDIYMVIEDALIKRIGDVRLDNFQNADLRIGRTFTFGATRIAPSLDIFNLGNVNTVLGRRRNQAAANANSESVRPTRRTG